jgi:hypothetical protein
MKLERKVYETRAQKVGDLFIGVGLMIGVNIVFGVISALLAGAFSSLSSDSGVFQTISSILLFALYCVPFAVNIGLIIYFGLTRYWIALGMLSVIASGLLITLCLSAACFVLLGGGLSGWFNNPTPIP